MAIGGLLTTNQFRSIPNKKSPGFSDECASKAARHGQESRAQAPAEDAEGPPARHAGGHGGERPARRPAAAARSPDRTSASYPGQIRPSLRRASGGARRRD